MGGEGGGDLFGGDKQQGLDMLNKTYKTRPHKTARIQTENRKLASKETERGLRLDTFLIRTPGAKLSSNWKLKFISS